MIRADYVQFHSIFVIRTPCLVDALEDQLEQANSLVTQIRKLYLVERHARDECLSAEQRYELRQQHSVPVLANLEPLLRSVQEKVLPQSPLGKAIQEKPEESGTAEYAEYAEHPEGA